MEEKIKSGIEKQLKAYNIDIAFLDTERPWGGFFVIEQKSTTTFIEKYFQDVEVNNLGNGILSPKILIVAPGKKLSWQYHLRREEIWKLIQGEAGIVRSETNNQQAVEQMKMGETIYLKKNERHRLVGMNDWGIIAEIWKHTDPENPSDENDIIRLQDDFGRD